ncbi:MAG: hypothetical protein DRR06_15830 [Gammaproteobacteria bacterium]|nr:MAG: hypothetical protein DRR06_15830 [Gammaproteobacteria bacterium]
MSAQITVQSGPNEATIVGSQSVAEIRAAFAGPFNIPTSAKARYKGVEVSESTLISEGILYFRVPTGEKGA